jgi:hypothetical protein
MFLITQRSCKTKQKRSNKNKSNKENCVKESEICKQNKQTKKKPSGINEYEFGMT